MVRVYFMFLKSGPSLLYVFKKCEFTLKVVRVYLKSGPSLPGPNLPGPSLLVFIPSSNLEEVLTYHHRSIDHRHYNVSSKSLSC